MTEIIPSPNIWRYPGVYEIENRSVDPDGVIEAAMRAIRPWDGLDVLDIGCGSGYHLPGFATAAASVVGVEPHPPLVQLARRRVASIDDDEARARIDVRAGTAQQLPVPSGSIDVVHARWAYFFGPGCEPGLAEIRRVLRRGGVAFVIDNDATRSTFGSWFRRWLPTYDPAAVEAFWARQGWSRRTLDIRWEMPTRADFEAVVRIEFSAEHADRILASHPGTSVDYAVNLFSYEAPKGLLRRGR
ncbi:class I SAM-dependent methyltransferase [Kineosporia sp. J2-2]|uniref:Class I SAM-dependent methyltransferase n=1 Tax=Kineosporia corallincola TaxID=2835133 RepID=A0ABS5T9I2_9ACTN|nr:class I SAM-dependent methyltransferase [Kineosporia corallincola]MBT0767727.1 class I SAM-dependent methyltransferase [Kineosporia corallincola]